MKDHLLATFSFNDQANKAMLKKIEQMSDPTEAIRHFSHLINCQYKWLARLRKDPNAAQLDWWDPLYAFEALEAQWEKSLDLWIVYLHAQTEASLATPVEYSGYDSNRWTAAPQDIALQLNYHSIHHRAQIQAMLRAQGLEPDFVDYIGTKAKRIGA